MSKGQQSFHRFSRYLFMQVMQVFLLCFLFFTFPSNSFANFLQLGNLSYQGSGCPSGTLSAILTPDGQGLSLLFDQFIAEAGGVNSSGERQKWDLKNCVITMNFIVPTGQQMTIKKIDYRGFSGLPQGSKGKVQIRYSFSRRQGLVYTDVFQGEKFQDFFFSHSIESRSRVWSACQENPLLQIHAELESRSNGRRESAQMTLDSADATAGLRYELALRPCVP